MPVLTWTDEADVIARANLDNAGLGGAVFCRDVERARRIADELETGTVVCILGSSFRGLIGD